MQVPTALLCVPVAAAALLALSAGPVGAQAVQGQVIDSTSGAPVGIGFVVLLDETGAEVERTLSTTDGRYRLQAPHGGVFQLRSERIGYRATLSPSITVPATGVVEFTLRVSAFPVRLAAVVVQGRDRCQVNPAESEATLTVWEEIRKALAAAAWGDDQELFLYHKYDYERDLNASRRAVEGERGSNTQRVSSPPFRSVDATVLARDGFIVDRADGKWYYTPDAHALLDDAFLNTHCFRVMRDPSERPGLLGLAFEPVPGRDLPEVEGALWLDEATSELRRLDVRYTQLPENVRDRRVGADVYFLMLPSGAWIVQRWQIRMPTIDVRVSRDGTRESWVTGFRDVGGEILEVATRQREVVYTATLAHVEGVIFDSTAAAPLPGASVTIPGTGLWTVSDRNGRYSLAAPLDGVYALRIAHPRLDSLGIEEPFLRVSLSRGDTTDAPIAIPHVDGVLARRCPRGTDRPDRRALVGTVFDRDRRTPIRNARVEATWQDLTADDRIRVRDRQQTTLSDETGRYLLCDLPRGRPVDVRAVHRGVWTEQATVVFPERERGTLLLARDRRSSVPFDEAHETSTRIWQVDLTLAGTPENEQAGETLSALTGIVVDDSTDRGIESAVVVLNDRDSAVTRVDGSFLVAHVRWQTGTNTLSVRRTGYRTFSRVMWIDEERRELGVRIALEREVPIPNAVDTVPAREPSSGMQQFNLRRQRARGRFVAAADIERMGASSVSDVLRRIPEVSLLYSGTGAGSNQYVGLTSASARCRAGQQQPLVYLDGAASGVDQLLAVPPGDIAGLELYNGPSEVPPQFNSVGADCGVIVVWTK